MNQYKIYFYSKSGELLLIWVFKDNNLDSVFQECYERIEENKSLVICELIQVYPEHSKEDDILSNKEKFLNLVSWKESTFKEDYLKRKENRPWLKVSQKIALQILEKLDEVKWNNYKFSEELNISFTSVNKLLSGKEDFSLSLLLRIQDVLNLKFML